MPKVFFVKRARKARPEFGIEVGDPYYTWSLYGEKRARCSKQPPTREQLTNNPHRLAFYRADDARKDLIREIKEKGSLASEALRSRMCEAYEEAARAVDDAATRMREYFPSDPRLQRMDWWARTLRNMAAQGRFASLEVLTEFVDEEVL